MDTAEDFPTRPAIMTAETKVFLAARCLALSQLFMSGILESLKKAFAEEMSGGVGR